jgi:superfamily II DNA or RNA helicase
MADTALTSTAPPEQGQLAEVRQRRYIVSDVFRSSLPAAPGTIPKPQHLVTLRSVDDEGLGEELQVVWELEPGARVHEKMALPEPKDFDDPARLDAFLDAVRWGAASVADTALIQSPFRSGIEFEAYQLDAVVRAVEMPRVNLLVADDVGLGKTIEAGLVLLELILRHRARRILVVVPASLQIKWQTEMRDKFGLEFRVVDARVLRELRRTRGLNANPWRHFPRLITSIDFLKRERPLRLLREELPPAGALPYPRRFDVLVLDEAHNVAPAGRGQYPIDSQRTAALRTLAPHFEHKLFLTATPHNGFLESFTALLELLDPQRFARGIRPDQQQLQIVMVRRLKSEITDWTGAPAFPKRTPVAIEVEYTPEEKQVHAALQEYRKLRLEAARDSGALCAAEFILKLLKKRLFSSPRAFADTLARHEESLRGTRRKPAEPPPVRLLQEEFDRVDEDYEDEEEFEDATREAIDTAAHALTPLDRRERELLAQMRDWARQATAVPDAKTRRLLAWLDQNIRPGVKWANERVIIFTEYRATQKWLFEMLATRGFTEGDRVMVLHGGMRTEDREHVKNAFQYDPGRSPVRILLATDAASEGIDLQNHCYRLIHFEIPWNPNRMEQRNGRIDRHGQRAKEVFVYHFVGQSWSRRAGAGDEKKSELEEDLEFLMTAVEKVEAIREDLGKVGPVIAAQVEEAMLGRRKRLDTARAERENEPVRKLLRFEQNVRERIRRLNDQLMDTRRELRLDPANIESVVHTALALAGQPPLVPVQVEGVERAFQVPDFRDASWAPCVEGLFHPHDGTRRPIVFDPALIKGRDDIVLAHLNHRLVQMCLRLLRAEIWAPEGIRKLARVTARLVPDSVLDAPAAIAHARLVLVGGDSQRLHEEVISAGGVIREGRLARLNVTQIRDAVAAGLDTQPAESVRRRLQELWPQLAGQMVRALEARSRDRTEAIQKALAERADSEVTKIRALLQELAKAIQEYLKTQEKRQLDLFEREQDERNRDALRARQEGIPEEIERETAQIRKRFADPTPRLFPVAVTFLVPRKHGAR